MLLFKGLLVVLLNAILVDNYVLRKFLGICPFLGVSKILKNSVGMSVAVILVMLLATAVTWPIQRFLLDPNGLAYMQTLVFILIIAALVQLVEIVMKKYMKPLYTALGVYLPLITTNCAVLGVTIANIVKGFTFAESMINSLGSGLGFLVAMVLFTGVRARVESSETPKAFEGLPLTLIAASILSLSFFGFTGVVENIFG